MAESNEVVPAPMNRGDRTQRVRQSSHYRRDQQESFSGSDNSMNGLTVQSKKSDSCHPKQTKKISNKQHPKQNDDDGVTHMKQTDEELIPHESTDPRQHGSKCNPEVRAKLRSLLLYEALQENKKAWEDPTEMASPRTFIFLTRPGRPWQYVIDAPAGHGADEPMALVPAIGIPEDTTHVAAKMRAIRYRKAKLKSAVAFLMEHNKVKDEAQDTFHESISPMRSAIRVNVEMVSLSDDSDKTEDEIIPMFAPLEDGPDPVVEQTRAEASVLHAKRRERRRSSYEAVINVRRTSRRVSQLMGEWKGTMTGAVGHVEIGMEALTEEKDRIAKFSRRIVGLTNMFKSYRKKFDS